jgi:hypothetical protein
MAHLTDHTVLGQLLAPVQHALGSVRGVASLGRALSMEDFLALGVLRHLRGMATLREQVQTLVHLDPAQALQVALPRSSWSDALAAPSRLAVLAQTLVVLNAKAEATLSDRLAGIPGLGSREVGAIDGTDQHESAHFSRCTPKHGGEDHDKGHALLTFYNLRRGLAQDVFVETRLRHETRMLRDDDRNAQAMTQNKGMSWLVDRALIDASFWDAKKAKLASPMITRMKSSLRIDSTEGLPIADDPVNAGVVTVFSNQLHQRSMNASCGHC